jgi:hypothetical protein
MGRYGSGFAPPRPALIRYPFQKTRLLPHPACFNGYLFNPTRHDILVLNKRRPIIENIAILTFGLFEFLTGPFKLAHVDFGDFLCLFLSANQNKIIEMDDTVTKRKRGRKPKIPTTEIANDVVISVPSTEPTTDPNDPSPSSRARSRGHPRKIKKHDNLRPNIAASPERHGRDAKPGDRALRNSPMG